MFEDREHQEEVARQAENPTGRSAYMDRWRERNPDFEGDPDDETLYSDAITQIDEGNERYNSLNSLNAKLAETISEDENLAQFIAMIASGVSVPRAVAESFGDLLGRLGEEDLAQYEQGLTGIREENARRSENAMTYRTNLANYISENNLTEEQAKNLEGTIYDFMGDVINLNIPVDMIALFDKGLRADEEIAAVIEDKDAEIAAAELAAKNETIEQMKESKTDAEEMPDLQGVKSGGQVRRKDTMATDETNNREEFVDRLEQTSRRRRN